MSMDRERLLKIAAEVVRRGRGGGKKPRIYKIRTPKMSTSIPGKSGRKPRKGTMRSRTKSPVIGGRTFRATSGAGKKLTGLDKLIAASSALPPKHKGTRGATDAADRLARGLRTQVGRPTLKDVGANTSDVMRKLTSGSGFAGKTLGAASDDLSQAIVKNLIGSAAIAGGARAAYRMAKPKSKTMRLKQALKGMFGKGSAGRKALAFGAGAAAIGAGIDAATDAQEAMAKPIKKKMYFKNMMKENPALSRENPAEVKKVFNTMFRFNKRLAADPLVAGSFMRRAMQFKDEGIQPVDVKSLVEATSKKPKKENVLRTIFPTSAAELRGFSE